VDGGANALIGSATTDVCHRLVDVGIGGLGLLGDQRRRRHQLAGLAVAALEHVDIEPGLLQRLSGLRFADRLDGRDALGASVEVVVAKNKSLRRRVRTDGSYLSANDPRVLAGLGSETRVEAVRVRWPDGGAVELKTPPVDRYTTVKQK